MSLIQKITTRRFEDVINQGYRFGLTGSVASVTDTAVQAGATDRSIVVTSFIISTTSATDVLVSLGFKDGVLTTRTFFSGYVKTGSPIVFGYGIGDERYSNPTEALVITTNAAGPTVYTVNGRIIGEKIALGYIQIEGAGHSGAPGYPVFSSGFSGFDRGGWPA